MTTKKITVELPPFEELVALAKHNPKAFELLKQDICEEVILSASHKMQERLWAQQSHIDRVIHSSKNPNHANIRLMKELTEQILKFQDALAVHSVDNTMHTADVIPFHHRKQQRC
jgi:dTDP-D-glucose 4,6-dehydratase